MTKINFHKGDLPRGLKFSGSIAVDAEMMGLNLVRDRLCLVQIADKEGNVHLVQIKRGVDCPNLKAVLTDEKLLKILHFARYDVAKIKTDLGIYTTPIYDTKIASKLCRPYAQSHGLKALCMDLLNVILSKEMQTSDWGADELTKEQQKYAANDVIHLHQLKEILDKLLKREGRVEVAEACFNFMPARATLDILGYDAPDIFEH